MIGKTAASYNPHDTFSLNYLRVLPRDNLGRSPASVTPGLTSVHAGSLIGSLMEA
jgi:hypothetical protein